MAYSSKSSVILGLSLTVPLMVVCLAFAIPIWIRCGYRFWVPPSEVETRTSSHETPTTKEVNPFLNLAFAKVGMFYVLVDPLFMYFYISMVILWFSIKKHKYDPCSVNITVFEASRSQMQI